ncbi:aminoglycoside phosphotransferase family protein [Candidatus Woesearchaeota archaeon]|jgi:aminoglycoside phosphotransferase (APT) family kinase protein|nr:aminoglycoside phosphotransferase family protein [Candidatus Woesearchaeota archaeon]MBT6520091.1 aminoglycoside phosphotransferase family protein [Candidatus Woesearchaeota archaeon]MBT7366696.1 aminoglycoside phosphotransferase family protein [Candidatus Woesearchaeota archaeon]
MNINKKQVEQICKKLNQDLVKFFSLASGNHNSNYAIVTTNKKYVLRIENNPQFKNLKKEYTLLKYLRPGLGPEVYFIDTSHKIIPFDYFVEEFIEGKHPKKLNDKFITLMAKWLKKLHQQKKPCKKHSMLKAIKPYFRNVNNHRNAIPSKTINKIDSLFNRVTDFCKKNDGLFANRKKACLLHRDLSRENIIYDGKKIILLDWEFSNYNFPEWDLVYFIQSLRLNSKQKDLFLKTYGCKSSKKSMKKLLIISLLNTCGDIGYSVWRLGLVKQKKLNKKLSPEISTRLDLDINRLSKIIRELES